MIQWHSKEATRSKGVPLAAASSNFFSSKAELVVGGNSSNSKVAEEAEEAIPLEVSHSACKIMIVLDGRHFSRHLRNWFGVGIKTRRSHSQTDTLYS